jgi:hypothetical protein
MTTLTQTLVKELPITYYPAVKKVYRDGISTLGWEPQCLWQASEQAIRSRHAEAFIADCTHEARGRRPAIYSLQLEGLTLHYTVEAEAIVIRGYSWEVTDEWEYEGGVYTEYEWYLDT